MNNIVYPCHTGRLHIIYLLLCFNFSKIADKTCSLIKRMYKRVFVMCSLKCKSRKSYLFFLFPAVSLFCMQYNKILKKYLKTKQHNKLPCCRHFHKYLIYPCFFVLFIGHRIYPFIKCSNVQT